MVQQSVNTAASPTAGGHTHHFIPHWHHKVADTDANSFDDTVVVTPSSGTPSTHGRHTNYSDPNEDEFDSRFAVHNPHVRECLAEVFGSFIMVTFGFGVNHQVFLSGEKNGTWLSINMCWGIAIMLAVHCSEGVSGSHLNPAVSVTKAVFKLFPWWKVPGYVASQLAGCFVGAFTIYMLYYPRINAVDPDHTFMHHHFVTHPGDGVSNYTAFYTEFLATAMLTVGIFCITDAHNRPASPYATPIHFMFLIWALGMAFGMNTGYAINPARDFGPRVFTCLAGWGFQVFTESSGYFWIPIVAPLMGGPFGGLLYKAFVQNHHPRDRHDFSELHHHPDENEG